jgi:hypothetical protein
VGIVVNGGAGGAATVSGVDVAPSKVTLGTGDALEYAEETSGQKLIVKKGTAAAPDTTLHPLLKVERLIDISDDVITGDGVEQCASIVGITVGTSDCEVQPVGGAFFAKCSSADAGDQVLGAPDACAIYGVGYITGSGTGSGIGAYLQGRSDSADGKVAALEIQTYNGTGADHAVNTTGYNREQAIWINANGAHRSACGIAFANAMGKQFETGIFFNAQVNNALTGGISAASIRDDSTSATSLAINGTHATAAILVASGAGPVRLGWPTAVQASALLEVHVNGNITPAVSVSAQGNQSVSIRLANNSGACQWITAAGADSQLTGSVAGDTMMKIGTASKSFHIGGTASVIEVTQGDALGFFNDATPATKQTVTGSRGANAALASLLTALAAYGLVTDSSSA